MAKTTTATDPPENGSVDPRSSPAFVGLTHRDRLVVWRSAHGMLKYEIARLDGSKSATAHQLGVYYSQRMRAGDLRLALDELGGGPRKGSRDAVVPELPENLDDLKPESWPRRGSGTKPRRRPGLPAPRTGAATRALAAVSAGAVKTVGAAGDLVENLVRERSPLVGYARALKAQAEALQQALSWLHGEIR